MNQSVMAKAISPRLENTLETNSNELVNDAKTHLKNILNTPKADKKLNDKEKAFVSEYLISKKAAPAALKAGYLESVAKTQAYTWVKPDEKKNKKLHVFKAIYLATQKAEQRAIRQTAHKISQKIIDADYVKQKTVEQIEKNNGEIPTHVTRTLTPEGEEELKEHYKYNPQAVLKALELLGKHKEIKAFDNSQEITANEGLVNLLASIGGTTKPTHLIQGECKDISEGELVTEQQENASNQEARSLLPGGNVPPPPPVTSDD